MPHDGCRAHVEVSNGTIPMSNAEKARWVARLAGEFTVVSEVGFKDQRRATTMTSAQWVDAIGEDLAAGAALVITEARESGRGGLCLPDGTPRVDVVDDVLDGGFDVDRLLFEAPTTELQCFFIKRLGASVNLGNIRADDVIALETLRLGLRSDTMLCDDALMRTTHDAFHLAIPVADLDEAQDFYVTGLGCKLARRYDDRITLDFFGDQVVCHLSEFWDRQPPAVPAPLRRHVRRPRRLRPAPTAGPRPQPEILRRTVPPLR